MRPAPFQIEQVPEDTRDLSSYEKKINEGAAALGGELAVVSVPLKSVVCCCLVKTHSKIQHNFISSLREFTESEEIIRFSCIPTSLWKRLKRSDIETWACLYVDKIVASESKQGVCSLGVLKDLRLELNNFQERQQGTRAVQCPTRQPDRRKIDNEKLTYAPIE